MNKQIIKEAESYQELDRKIKDLQAKQRPLKKSLLKYAENNKSEFDEVFQLKFPNGTYISQRIKEVVEGSKAAKWELLENTAFELSKAPELDETLVIEEFNKNSRLRKLLTKLGLKITQKETFAIYAG